MSAPETLPAPSLVVVKPAKEVAGNVFESLRLSKILTEPSMLIVAMLLSRYATLSDRYRSIEVIS